MSSPAFRYQLSAISYQLSASSYQLSKTTALAESRPPERDRIKFPSPIASTTFGSFDTVA